MMLILLLKLRKKSSQNVKRFWTRKAFEKCLNFFGQWFLLAQQEWRFSGSFWLTFIFCIYFNFHFVKSLFQEISLYEGCFHFKKHVEQNYLRHETSLIVAVIVILKSISFYFKTTITERWNNDKTTIRTIWRYLLMFILTIAKDYSSYALC